MKQAARRKQNQVRIIGGEWRGRKLDFPDAQGLRPTPDRVRETVFNWLQGYLPGARCLDLFAGTGVLGFEAVSRGAASATLVERDRSVYHALQKNMLKLDMADRVRIINTDALDYLLAGCDQQFDIIFIDPPYGKGLADSAISLIDQADCLKPGGLMYMEHESEAGAAAIAENWRELKHKQAGQVSYYLLRSIHTANQE
jgi:16S rRNA (guanine966-N2)-methyltransferase